MGNILGKLKIDSFLELFNTDLTVERKRAYFGYYRTDILNMLGFDVDSKKSSIYEMGLFTDNRPYMQDSNGVSAIMKTFVALLVQEIVKKSELTTPSRIFSYLDSGLHKSDKKELKEIILYNNINPLELAMLKDEVVAQKFRYTKKEAYEVKYRGAIHLYDCLQYSMENAISISVEDYEKATDAMKQAYNSYDNALIIFKDIK